MNVPHPHSRTVPACHAFWNPAIATILMIFWNALAAAALRAWCACAIY